MTREDIYNRTKDKIVEKEKNIYDKLNDVYHIIIDLQDIVNDAKKEGFDSLLGDENVSWWDQKIDAMINELKRLIDE